MRFRQWTCPDDVIEGVRTVAENLADDATTYPLRAVDRVCSILDALSDSPLLSLPQVATAAELPKSSAFRYLAALEARHYVERAGDLYRLGVAFRPQHQRQEERLVEVATPLVEALNAELEETVNVGVLDGTQVVHTVVVESPHMMRLAARVGERGFIHSTALGKAMGATLTDERVKSMLAMAGMPAFTTNTITTIDGFLAELEATRAQGYGLDEAENQKSGRCVGVVIPNLTIMAGVSVSAPADRLSREAVPGIAAQLHRVAREISERMQVSGTPTP